MNLNFEEFIIESRDIYRREENKDRIYEANIIFYCKHKKEFKSIYMINEDCYERLLLNVYVFTIILK